MPKTELCSIFLRYIFSCCWSPCFCIRFRIHPKQMRMPNRFLIPIHTRHNRPSGPSLLSANYRSTACAWRSLDPDPLYISRSRGQVDTQKTWNENILQQTKEIFLQRRRVPVLAVAGLNQFGSLELGIWLLFVICYLDIGISTWIRRFIESICK